LQLTARLRYYVHDPRLNVNGWDESDIGYTRVLMPDDEASFISEAPFNELLAHLHPGAGVAGVGESNMSQASLVEQRKGAKGTGGGDARGAPRGRVPRDAARAPAPAAPARESDEPTPDRAQMLQELLDAGGASELQGLLDRDPDTARQSLFDVLGLPPAVAAAAMAESASDASSDEVMEL
jgi:hypothetical protein